MTETPTICERTIAYGNQRWRVNSSGQWQVMMWGWWPDSNGTPSWRWSHIDKSRVPKEVLNAI
jgi:hypothetical protein